MNIFFERLDKLDGLCVIAFLIDLVENTCEAEDVDQYAREMARCLLAGLLSEQVAMMLKQAGKEIA